MQKYIGTMPFNLWGHGDYIRIPQTPIGNSTLPEERDNIIPIPEEGMFNFNLDRGWFEGHTGEVWRQFSMALAIDVYDLNNNLSVVEFLTMPFYTYDGRFTPIAVNADQMITYHEADGNITYVKVS